MAIRGAIENQMQHQGHKILKRPTNELGIMDVILLYIGRYTVKLHP